ncbi:hypothetical protein DIPPA_04445 [Diplonema papillatum]|nr:hypothetical protein DIPPA_04445 [Diplonema papillatum]
MLRAVLLLATKAASGLSVLSCGAVGDGLTDNSKAFRTCAARAPQEGGQLLVLRRGGENNYYHKAGLLC